MSLPIFPKKSQEVSVSGPDEIIARKHDEGKEDEFDSLEGAMSELHSALNSKDYKSAAQIFRSAFELMDSEPHVEGKHI